MESGPWNWAPAVRVWVGLNVLFKCADKSPVQSTAISLLFCHLIRRLPVKIVASNNVRRQLGELQKYPTCTRLQSDHLHKQNFVARQLLVWTSFVNTPPPCQPHLAYLGHFNKPSKFVSSDCISSFFHYFYVFIIFIHYFMYLLWNRFLNLRAQEA